MHGRWWLALWPGLAGLWLRGRFAGLAAAIAFAVLLNFALLTTLVWPRLIARELPVWSAPLAAWVLVLWFWVIARRQAAAILSLEAAKSLQPDAASDAALIEAQQEYLRGHWLEAETLLARLLVRRPGDAEARLLLATVYRASGRKTQAAQQLAELSAMPTAGRWREEIQVELKKLSRQSDNREELAIEAPAACVSHQRRAA